MSKQARRDRDIANNPKPAFVSRDRVITVVRVSSGECTSVHETKQDTKGDCVQTKQRSDLVAGIRTDGQRGSDGDLFGLLSLNSNSSTSYSHVPAFSSTTASSIMARAGGDDFEDDFVADDLVALSEEEYIASDVDDSSNDNQPEDGPAPSTAGPCTQEASKKRKRREKEKEKKIKVRLISFILRARTVQPSCSSLK